MTALAWNVRLVRRRRDFQSMCDKARKSMGGAQPRLELARTAYYTQGTILTVAEDARNHFRRGRQSPSDSHEPAIERMWGRESD